MNITFRDKKLLVLANDDPITTDQTGRFIWLEIKGIEVIEITDYH